MPNYTLKNLTQDVEDSAPGFGLAPNVQAHFARDVLECEKGAVGYFRVAPNARMPFGHTQKTQEEFYVVISGSGRMKLDDEIVDLRPLDAVRVAPETVRGIEGGPEGIEYVAFGAPHTGPGDGEVVQGWWSD
jgi:mannose-6-phosphate isomerase-like protein (cupin superfamily)